MAHEPNMKPDRTAYAVNTDDGWSSLTVLSDQRMLSTLGNSLRRVYEDVTDSAQPNDLMRLAAMIDARRNHSTG
ncbi:hypothetical protein [Methylobacterium goesingense]|jgi:hypothetical protein|uniref:Anti-sigma factor NepR domain-containing protein n=1 Tax=Methylobacterium goesingense TaxID=243690 RepID=A0ABV2L4J5_9HYPH|nr:hypothetical protein [Methylobacterium goesingense]GJD71965.1 hypothetical protein CFIICLFH_0174 [Methylobacterium goesingense]